MFDHQDLSSHYQHLSGPLPEEQVEISTSTNVKSPAGVGVKGHTTKEDGEPNEGQRHAY